MVWSSRKDFSGTNLISLTSVFAALRAENDLKNVYDPVERVITSEFDFCGDVPTSGPPNLGRSPTTECRRACLSTARSNAKAAASPS